MQDHVECSLGCEIPIGLSEITQPYIAHWVQGWEMPRAQGGANHIALREVLPEYAHVSCVRMAASGVHPRQVSLL